MKTVLYSAAFFALLATACRHTPKADEATTTAPQNVEAAATAGTQYSVDVQKSTVKWIGAKPTGTHPGEFKIKEGTLAVAGNAVQGGRFVIDLQSLQAYDEDGKANAKLTGHLKNEDFFDVARYGTATFDITNVQEGTADNKVKMEGATHMVTGNLKIKNITKGITFPARINTTGDAVIADAEFNMNRTNWGITYGNDKSLGDKFIRPDVNVKIHLEANK
ncbi:MAG: hypothetical protein K0Q79_917 [Flavipsychrobacter sp.]|nr:hypothetical protein [Flavipsychrobacter sp.]